MPRNANASLTRTWRSHWAQWPVMVVMVTPSKETAATVAADVVVVM